MKKCSLGITERVHVVSRSSEFFSSTGTILYYLRSSIFNAVASTLRTRLELHINFGKRSSNEAVKFTAGVGSGSAGMST